MQFPKISDFLKRDYSSEALGEILLGTDQLPFPSKEKQHIFKNFAETADMKRMQGDTLLLCAFYNTAFRNVFKYAETRTEYINGLSLRDLKRELTEEVSTLLESTDFNQVGKNHRTLLSLMLVTENLPKRFLTEAIEKTNVNSRDIVGKSAVDFACMSMMRLEQPHKNECLDIVIKSGITGVEAYKELLEKHQNTVSKSIVGSHVYIDGFKKILDYQEELENSTSQASSQTTLKF